MEYVAFKIDSMIISRNTNAANHLIFIAETGFNSPQTPCCHIKIWSKMDHSIEIINKSRKVANILKCQFSLDKHTLNSMYLLVYWLLTG